VGSLELHFALKYLSEIKNSVTDFCLKKRKRILKKLHLLHRYSNACFVKNISYHKAIF